MKVICNNITIVILSLIISFSACSETIDENNESYCIDKSLIDSSAVCYMIYDPVCGCNEVTYSNECVAENNGVLIFEKGSCN